MSIVLGPLLVVAGFGLYMGSQILLSRYRRMPWEFLAVSALGAAISVGRAISTPTIGETAAAIVAVALLAFLVWYFTSFTFYAAREDRPRVGDPFPAFRLPASDGTTYDSAEHRDTRKLLVFYRGSW